VELLSGQLHKIIVEMRRALTPLLRRPVEDLKSL